MPSLPLLCSSQVYHQLCTVQGQYNQYKGKPVCVLAGPLENINLEMCVYISLPLNQSGLNTTHSSHVLSKLSGKSRGTHHSLFLFHALQEVTSKQQTPSPHYQTKPSDTSAILCWHFCHEAENLLRTSLLHVLISVIWLIIVDYHAKWPAFMTI